MDPNRNLSFSILTLKLHFNKNYLTRISMAVVSLTGRLEGNISRGRSSKIDDRIILKWILNK
jgi:hypothetical protein